MQRMSLRHSLFRDVATFMGIALVTVAWASTTNMSVSLFSIVRNVLIALFVLLLAYLIIRRPSVLGTIILKFAGISVLGVYSVAILGIVAPEAQSTIAAHVNWVALSSAIAGVFYLTPPGRAIISDRAAWMYIIFALAIIMITALLGGLQIHGLPRFVYELTTEEGNEISYSQGISKFYGLAAVFSALLFSRTKKLTYKNIFILGFLLFFLSLSLLGGGRGDFLVTLLLSLMALSWSTRFLIFSIAVVVHIFMQDQIDALQTDYITLFDRFALLSFSWGMRDTLFYDAINILAEETSCTIFGCGIGYFQSYMGYPPSMYPHNVPIEFLLSFGLLLALPIAIMISLGIIDIYRSEGSRSNFLFLFLFYLGISLKSGSIITSYLLVGSGALLYIKGIRYLVETTSHRKAPLGTN